LKIALTHEPTPIVEAEDVAFGQPVRGNSDLQESVMN
jgi:hypothetical protein